MPEPHSPPFSNVTNNSWYKINPGSKTVFVFAHGIFSASRDCWLCDDKSDPSRSAFWPDLVANDQRLDNPSVYLGGYFTVTDSGNYGIQRLRPASSIATSPSRTRPICRR